MHLEKFTNICRLEVCQKKLTVFTHFFVAQPFKRRSPSLKTTKLFNIYLECIFLQPVAKYFYLWCNKVNTITLKTSTYMNCK